MPESFYNLLTLLGQAEYAAAIAGSSTVSLTHMVLGDGNGNYYEPSTGQTALIHEVYRAGINSITTDPENPGWVIVELVVPASVGGWWIREVGIISSTGNLFAIGKFPATYKPLLSEGSGKELIVKMIFEVVSTSAITITVDPTIVVAKKSDITAHDASATAHADIREKIGADIATHDESASAHGLSTKSSLWVTETAIARVSNTQFTVAEDKSSIYTKNRALSFTQTASAYGYVSAIPSYSAETGLTTVTVRGCVIDAGLTAVKYGQQVANAPKQVDDLYAVTTGSNNAYALTLSPALDAYIPGMPIIFKANFTNTDASTLNISGLGAVALKKNVSDALEADDISVNKIYLCFYDGTNIQVLNLSKKDVLIGSEMLWPTETPPAGWLEEDGSSLTRATYPALFSVIGTMHGAADGTHFNLPDSRGKFPRIWANGQTTDPDRATRTAPTAPGATISAGDHVGTNQGDEIRSHYHQLPYPTGSGAVWNTLGSIANQDYHSSIRTEVTGGNETRSINTYRMMIIKAY